MTRSRFVTYLVALALSGLGLTVLMAAKAAGEKTADPPKPAGSGKRLVCLGYVDTKDKMFELRPDNYPQPARVTKVLVKEGAKVKEGDPLLEFDVEALDIAVKLADNAIALAQAEQAKAEAAVRAHDIQIRSLQKEYEGKQKELANKKDELKEVQHLREIGAANQLQLDAAKTAYAVAEDNLEAARIKLDGLRAEVPNYLVDLAKENVKKAQLSKTQAEHARDQVRCRAPADGRIVRSFVSEGTIFGMGSRDPAFWFIKDGPLIVRAEVTPEFARRVAEGRTAEIEDESDADQRWTGKVVDVPNQFLPKRQGNAGLLDLMPAGDDRVLECQVSIDPAPGKPAPRFGQKVRITLRD
jgi:multidrug efflux pump subunit AcrA (membrane-fusion protein)